MSPLEPFKKKVNHHGLFNTSTGRHPPVATGSCSPSAHYQARCPRGITVDQMIAITGSGPLHRASSSPASSDAGYHETNSRWAYSSHIFVDNADSGAHDVTALAFDTLFENRGSVRNLSILDRVRESAAELSRQVSSTDQYKLDEFMTSVREVEKRVDGMRKNQEKAADLAKLKNKPVFSMDRPQNGLPEDFREHTRLMCDVIALAFQTDKTRVATLLLARDLSALYYPFLDVRNGHHAASHDNLSDGYERISRFHLSQMAYLATKLDSMPEGDGTVLTLCLCFSNLGRQQAINAIACGDRGGWAGR